MASDLTDLYIVSCEFDFECLALLIENVNLIVVTIYRSQLGRFGIFVECLNDIFDKIKKVENKS